MRTSVICAAILMISVGGNVTAQENQPVAGLFERFLAPKTTDKAAEQLLKRAKVDHETQKYLTEHLPPVIEKGPKAYGQSWLNAVKLSGELNISEAAPALSKWIKT